MTIDEAIKTISDIYDDYFRSETDTVNLSRYDAQLLEVHTLLENYLQEKQDRDNPQPLTLEQLRERDGKPVWCSANKLYGVLGKRENEIVIGFSYGWDWLEDLIRCPIYDYELKEQVKSNEK